MAYGTFFFQSVFFTVYVFLMFIYGACNNTAFFLTFFSTAAIFNSHHIEGVKSTTQHCSSYVHLLYCFWSLETKYAEF